MTATTLLASEDFILVEGNPWPTVRGLAKRLGVSRATVDNWDTYCEYLEEGLGPVYRRFGRTAHRAKTYDPDKVGTLETIRGEVQSGKFTNRRPVKLGEEEVPPGETWLSLLAGAEALKLIHPERNTRSFLGKLVRSGRIGHKKFGFLEPDPNAHWILQKDFSKVAEAAAKHGDGEGRDKKKRVRRSPLCPKRITDCGGEFKDEDPVRYTLKKGASILNMLLKEAASPLRVHRQILNRWAYSGLPSNISGLFPEGLDLPKRRIPGTVRQLVRTISRTDLETISEAIVETGTIRGAGGKLLSSIDVVDHFGITNLRDKVMVRCWLKYLPHQRVARPRARRQGCQTSARYDLAEVERQLTGRPLLEVARESFDGYLVNSPLGKSVLEAVGEDWRNGEEVRRRLAGKQWSHTGVSLALKALAGKGLAERNPPISQDNKSRRSVWRITQAGEVRLEEAREQAVRSGEGEAHENEPIYEVAEQVPLRALIDGYTPNGEMETKRIFDERTPADKEPPDTILFISGGVYKINGVEKKVTRTQDYLLQAFMKKPTMNLPEAARTSGLAESAVCRALKELEDNYESIFKVAVVRHGKGKKNEGGYTINVISWPRKM